jgi:hypothetical protein
VDQCGRNVSIVLEVNIVQSSMEFVVTAILGWDHLFGNVFCVEMVFTREFATDGVWTYHPHFVVNNVVTGPMR